MITIRAEMNFTHEVDPSNPGEARRIAVGDILRGSEGDIYTHAYELFEYADFDAWTVVKQVEDREGKIIQIKPWYSWKST